MLIYSCVNDFIVNEHLTIMNLYPVKNMPRKVKVMSIDGSLLGNYSISCLISNLRMTTTTVLLVMRLLIFFPHNFLIADFLSQFHSEANNVIHHISG